MHKGDFLEAVNSFSSLKERWGIIYNLLRKLVETSDSSVREKIKEEIQSISPRFVSDAKKLLYDVKNYGAAVRAEIKYEGAKGEAASEKLQTALYQKPKLEEMQRELENYLQIGDLETAPYRFNLEPAGADIKRDSNDMMIVLRGISNIIGDREPKITGKISSISQKISEINRTGILKMSGENAFTVLNSVRTDIDALSQILERYARTFKELEPLVKKLIAVWDKLLANVAKGFEVTTGIKGVVVKGVDKLPQLRI